MKYKYLVLFCFIIILSVSAVSAADNTTENIQLNDATGDLTDLQTLNQNESITTSENVYEIDESNYDQFFDSDSGRITGNISNGDEIRLGNLTDKKFTIDKTITIMPISSDDCLINSMINLIQGSDKSIVKGIKIINNENTTFINAMEIYKANNIKISDSLFNSTNPIKISLLVNESNNVSIADSTFINSGSGLEYIYNIYSTPDENVSITNCTFEGGNKYNNIISEDLRKIERNASKFEAKFMFAIYPLINETVKFKINDIEYERTTDEEGIARIAINLAAGNYTIQSINPNSGEVKNNTITVLPRIVENNDLEKFYRNESQYWIKVLDDEGNPAKANEIVTFNINGVFYNRTTNASGYVKLNINLQPRDYVITAEYKGCRVSNKIKVKPILFADDLTKKYGTPNQFEAKLLDGQGNPLANTNVTFNINGVFYSRATDINGTAKLNINLMAGEYIITSSYNGVNVANKVTVTA